jgi:hypothetical protein
MEISWTIDGRTDGAAGECPLAHALPTGLARSAISPFGTRQSALRRKITKKFLPEAQDGQYFAPKLLTPVLTLE